MNQAIASLIGYITFLVAFFWLPFSVLFFPYLITHRWPRIGFERARKSGLWLCLGGIVVFLLLWNFVLPDWWIKATPAWNSE